jgi:hypothetical protein
MRPFAVRVPTLAVAIVFALAACTSPTSPITGDRLDISTIGTLTGDALKAVLLLPPETIIDPASEFPTIDALFEHLDSGGFACVSSDSFAVATIAYRASTVKARALPGPVHGGGCWN